MHTLIVDSYMEIINRLKELISESDSVKSVHTAVSYEEATELFNSLKPDIVVLDINLPGNKSFEFLKEVRRTNLDVLVIVLSIHIDDHIKHQCLALGADYFFDKYTEFDKIPGIIKLRKAG